MAKYLVLMIVVLLSFPDYSFSKSRKTKHQIKVEKKIDEIYNDETALINSMPFALEFNEKFEKIIKKSIRQELKARFADSLSAFGSGLQGSTANPETFTTTRIKNERSRIYEQWINEVNIRREQLK